MKEEVQKFFKETITRFSWSRVGFILLVFFLSAGLFVALLSVYGYTFRDRTLPGLTLGEFPVGRMDRSELKLFLEKVTDKLVDEGWHFVYEKNGKKETLILSPVLVVDGGSYELAHFDIDREVDRLLSLDKNASLPMVGWRALSGFLNNKKLSFENFNLDQFRLQQTLSDRLLEEEKFPENANVHISDLSPLVYEIMPPSSGVTINYEVILKELEYNWSFLNNQDLVVEKVFKEAEIDEAEVGTIVDKLSKIFEAGGLQLAYRDPETKREYDWQIGATQLAEWLEVKKDEDRSLYFGFNFEKAGKYLEQFVSPQINVAARDAKFKMGEDGRVVEFQGSRPGIALNIYGTAETVGTLELLENAFRERFVHDSGFTKVVTAAVDRVQPNIKTGDVNDLGINEVLGVGISSYAGSPTNRIKNIKLAVNKLNGVVIGPGQEFSAIKFLSPFTAEAGYLPEMVIKGDEIKPEIGGGLCQIGTTLFRMAMNSGMKISERRNHSLVVSYYNDLTNGNPGTDATIYEPAPDFKFLNDTNNSVLIQTEIDIVNQRLYFTLWGLNDGRKAYYSLPKVLRWLPAGEKKIIETTKLEPGVTSCQHAYTGADAVFTYTRELPGDKKEEVVFESHYRPLPEICLVGVAENTASSTPTVEGSLLLNEG